MSASWRVHKGAAIACSSVRTVTPSRGRVIGLSFTRSRSEGARQAEDVLGYVGIDQVGGNRRHLVEARLAELALDVVFLGEAEATVRLQADVGRLPARLGRQVLGHVGLRAA